MVNLGSAARGTRGVLNGLIVACHDDILLHDATASLVTGERQRRLEGATRRSEVFVEELGHLVAELGGKPARVASPGVVLRDLLESVRAWLIGGEHIGDRYALCARNEAKTAEHYEEALRWALPQSVRPIVERQLAAISSERDELRRRSIV